MTDPQTLSEFRDYMREGREFRDKVVTHMAETTTELKHFREYVETCDTDREDHGKRLSAMETAHSNYKAVAASWIAAIPVISGLVSWWVSKNTGA